MPQLTWSQIKSLLSAAASIGAFGALVVFVGRLWTQSYYAVIGLPTSDIEFDAIGYAFQAREALMMIVLGGAISLLLVALNDRMPHLVIRSLRTPMSVRHLLLPAWLNWCVYFGLGFAGLVVLTLFADQKSQHFDVIWQSLGPIGLCSGLCLGLTAGMLGIAVLQPQGYRVLAGAGILAIVLVFLPWVTTQLAAYNAESDLRKGVFPQAILQFKGGAPAALARSDDPSRTQPVHVVLVTKSRVAVAYPFGCRTVRAPKDVAQAGQEESIRFSETCDVFTFSRDDVASMRILAQGTTRPFNDEPGKPLDITFAEGPGVYSQRIDLTAAGSDTCGIALKNNLEFNEVFSGVWFRVSARQTGRLTFDNDAAGDADVYVQPMGEGRCVYVEPGSNKTGRLNKGIRIEENDQVLVLAGATRQGPRLIRRLQMRFEPLEVRKGDCNFKQDDPDNSCKEEWDPLISIPIHVPNESKVTLIADVAVPLPTPTPRPTATLAAPVSTMASVIPRRRPTSIATATQTPAATFGESSGTVPFAASLTARAPEVAKCEGSQDEVSITPLGSAQPGIPLALETTKETASGSLAGPTRSLTYVTTGPIEARSWEIKLNPCLIQTNYKALDVQVVRIRLVTTTPPPANATPASGAKTDAK